MHTEVLKHQKHGDRATTIHQCSGHHIARKEGFFSRHSGLESLQSRPVISVGGHWRVSSLHQTIKLDLFPNFLPTKLAVPETAIKFSWLPLQRTASKSPRRERDMSNATKVEEQAVSTVTLTPSSPRQKEIRFAAILALDGNGKKVVSTFAFLLLHSWFFKPLVESTNRRPPIWMMTNQKRSNWTSSWWVRPKQLRSESSTLLRMTSLGDFYMFDPIV